MSKGLSEEIAELLHEALLLRLHVFAERPAVRLTYDRGSLEIMSPLYEHESDADFLGRSESLYWRTGGSFGL